MSRAKIVRYTVEFDALDELSDDFVKRIIYEFFRSKMISVTRSGLTPDAADEFTGSADDPNWPDRDSLGVFDEPA
jgi:hypothetical protein